MDHHYPCDLVRHMHDFQLDHENGLADGTTQLCAAFPAHISRNVQRFEPQDEYTRSMGRLASAKDKQGAPSAMWRRDLFNYKRYSAITSQLQLAIQEIRHNVSVLGVDFVNAADNTGSTNAFEAMWALDHLGDYLTNTYHQGMECLNILQCRVDYGPEQAQRMQDELFAPTLQGYAPRFQKIFQQNEKEQRAADAKEHARHKAVSKTKDRHKRPTDPPGGGGGKKL